MSKCEGITMETQVIPNTETPIREYAQFLNDFIVCGVMTGNATYSLSPKMHNSAYEKLGLGKKYLYVAHSVSEEGLEPAIQAIRDIPNYRGISVGVPHKQTVIPLLDEIDDAARKIGAVNTIVIEREDSRVVLKGTNTDWIGIREPLRQRIDLKGKKVAILGAGGAARAAVYAVLQEGATATILNRTLENAQKLAKDFNCEAKPLDDAKAIQEADVIIHATKLGMSKDDPLPISPKYIEPRHVLFDVVYHRELDETNLAKAAKQKGATVIEGREMLLWQGVEQFRLFTRHDAPVEVMRQAIL